MPRFVELLLTNKERITLNVDKIISMQSEPGGTTIVCVAGVDIAYLVQSDLDDTLREVALFQMQN